MLLRQRRAFCHQERLVMMDLSLNEYPLIVGLLSSAIGK